MDPQGPKTDAYRPFDPGLFTPEVDLVVPVYNRIDMTREFLTSLKKHTRHPYRLFLVDNGSDDLPDSLIDGFEKAEIIRCSENLGFAAGCNRGLVKGRNLLAGVVNNDLILTEGWLGRLVRALLSDPAIAAAAPCANYSAGFQQVDLGPYENEAAMHDLAAGFARTNNHRIEDVEFLTGMCLIARRNVLQVTRGFDERFGKGNFEDNDLCLRIKKMGLRLVVARDCFVHHHGNRTFQALGIDYRAHMNRTKALYDAKWRDDAYIRGCRLLEGKRPTEALSAYAESLRGPEPNPEALFRSGLALTELTQHDAAARAFRQYLRACPESTRGRMGLGQALLMAGRTAEGLTELNAVLATRFLRENERQEITALAHAFAGRQEAEAVRA